MKTWQVGPYRDDWVAIVHADTRGKARQMGAAIDGNDFASIRAIRLPQLDGKLVTAEGMADAGFPEDIEGEELEGDVVLGYIDFCQCDICIESRHLLARPSLIHAVAPEPPGEGGT